MEWRGIIHAEIESVRNIEIFFLTKSFNFIKRKWKESITQLIAANLQNPTFQAMTETAVQLIREMVLSGDYKPGTRLLPTKVETELGLGKMAIRALRERSGSGMAVSPPNKGVTVVDAPSFEEIRALYETRIRARGVCHLFRDIENDSFLFRLPKKPYPPGGGNKRYKHGYEIPGHD